MIFYKKLKPILALTFDLDDTLYENHSVIIKAEKSLQQFMQSHYPATQTVHNTFWREQYSYQLKLNPKLQHDMGKLRQLSLVAGFKTLGLASDAATQAADQCFAHFYYHRSNFRLAAATHTLLQSLCEKRPLVAITNGNVNLEQIGIADYFSGSFKASVEHKMKPDKAMFEQAQEHLQIPSQNILHVGDNLHKDVYGALKAGYQTAWYAHDRPMDIGLEYAPVLPHVQLQHLGQLLQLI
jgi:putative hydrolase of the HAD superfamily